MTNTNNTGIDPDYLFYPKSVAVVGASSDQSVLKASNLFIEGILKFGYQGKVYAVGATGGEVHGLNIYHNIRDIPDAVEYVISSIPNTLVPQLVADCGEKGVKVLHLFTSGFSEIEDQIGKKLHDEVMRIAQQYEIRLLGPNCMGVYCPSSRFSFDSSFSSVAGKVGFLSQSGGQSMMGIKEANQRGIYFSKVVSYGNAADINECDLIEYLTDNTETDIITAYIEGTNHGVRLLKALRKATMRKPVVIFKGGDTEGGAQAAISHTSSIAGSRLTWESLFRQTGVIRVYNVQEMFDVVSVLQRCTEPQGLQTLIVGHGGGAGVQASDDCCRAGLRIPVLPPNLRQTLKRIYLSEAGNIFKNPLDINPFQGMDVATKAFAAVADWNNADLIILHSTPDEECFMPRSMEYQVIIDTIMEWAKLSKNKPVLLVLNSNTVHGDDGLDEKSLKRMIDAGFAAFPSTKRAAEAWFRVYQYYQWRNKHSTPISA